MRRIQKQLYKLGNVYHYQLDDGSEVTSIQEYEVGEKVRHWFDEKYNMLKIGKLCPKCGKPARQLPSPEHEFCTVKRS